MMMVKRKLTMIIATMPVAKILMKMMATIATMMTKTMMMTMIITTMIITLVDVIVQKNNRR